MQGLEPNQLIGSLLYVAMALFVIGGLPLARLARFRQGAILVYAAVVTLVLIEIALWLTRSGS